MTARRELVFWFSGALVVIALLYLLRGILLPFAAGLAVAYFLDPAVDKLESWRLSRTLATSFITALFFAIVIALVVVLYPIVEGQIVGFISRLPDYARSIQETVQPLAEKIVSTLSIRTDDGVRDALASLAEGAVGWLGSLVKGLFSGGLALFNVVSLVFITPVVAFYLLRDWDHLVARVDKWLPRRHVANAHEQFRLIDAALAGFLRGQALVCLLLGVFYAAALSLIGLDFGLLIGLFGGLVAFIPYVGAILTFAVSVLFGLLQFWPDMVTLGLVVAVFAAGQVLEGAILTPRLVGGRIGLHPVWIVFALLAGGALFGFIGIIVAVPVAAVVGVLSRFLLDRYLHSRVYLGGETGPDGGQSR